MSSPFPGRSGVDPVIIDRLVALLGSHFDEEQRVVPLGFRNIGGNQSAIRFRASRATLFVRYHVQSTAGAGSTRGLFTRGLGRHQTLGLYARGLGVGADLTLAYDPDNAVAAAQVDCRQDRQQEVTITRNGVDRYVVYLIPSFLETDGSHTLFDGDDAADQMAFIDLGV